MLTIVDQFPIVRCNRLAVGCLLLVVLPHVQTTAPAAEPLFAAPQPKDQVDEIVLVSTRSIGTVCDSERLSQELRCERMGVDTRGQSTWQAIDWRELLAAPGANRQTIIYVHGNRVGPGKDLSDGLQVYRSLKKDYQPSAPVRFVIWSWPATPIPGPVKDFRVKAAYTHRVAWQFAWFLDQMPADSRVSLVGYSYGARVVSGALQLLSGGALDELRLDASPPKERPPIRAALIAAAYDVDWVQPGKNYGLAIRQLDRLVLSTNTQDPVMRFYHLSNGRGRVHALGRSGIEHPSVFRSSARHIKEVDFTDPVGRSHGLADYLAASEKMSLVWRQMLTQNDQRPIGRVAALLELLPWTK